MKAVRSTGDPSTRVVVEEVTEPPGTGELVDPDGLEVRDAAIVEPTAVAWHALRLGVHVGTEGLYDVVIEAAGTEGALARAIELAAPRGVVASVGVYGGRVEIPWHTLFMREVTLVPSIAYCAHDTGKEMAEAFRVAADKSSRAIRVVLEV